MNNWLSRFSYKYPKSLVYMLQASEYNISKFIDWYKQTRDFSNVQKRKSLEKTLKSTLLLIIAWVLLLIFYGIGLYLLITRSWSEKAPAIVFIVFAPYIIPYLLSGVVILGRYLIQKPIELALMKETKEILKKHKATKIAVAGSFGKTSMREIIKTILSSDKKVAAPPSSYNTPLGISKFVKNLEGNEDVIVFEFGEYYPGDIEKLSKIVSPDIGVITGVNEAHLKKFRTLDNTTNTIFELSNFVESKNLYINGESNLAKKNAPKESIIYSKEGAEEWKIKESKTDLSGLEISIEKNGKKIKAKSQLIGFHHLGPLSAAVHLSDKLGIPPEKIKEGISKTRAFEHRLQPKEMEGITLIDDSYNGNPDGVKAAIDFLGSIKNKRRFYVTPGLVEMGPKKEEIHKHIGKQLAKAGIEKIVLIKNSVTPYIQEGLKKENFKGDIIWFEEGLKAYNSLDALTVKGDVVLIQNDWPDQYN